MIAEKRFHLPNALLRDGKAMRTVGRTVEPPSERHDIKGKTLRGGAVTLGFQALKFTLRTASTILLARLLSPSDFGLVAMVTGVTGFIALFKDAGLSTATVQRETITEDQLSTLFWINVLVGVLLTIISIVCAPIVVRIYSEPRIFWIFVAVSFSFLITALGVQHQALLQRHMRFLALSAIDIVSLAASLAVALFMALKGFKYWALVGMVLTLPIVNTASLWVTCRWVPGPMRRRCGIRSLLHFGRTVTLNGFTVYLAYNLEKILLGRYCGTDALGLYTRVQSLISLPMDQLNSAIGTVAIPTLARLQTDIDRFKRYFLNGYNLVLSATIPITVTCVVFAHELVSLMLGPKWIHGVPVFRLLAPTVLAFAFINPFSWLLLASGQAVRSMRIALLIAPVVIVGYVFGLRHGPEGVAIGYSCMMTLLIAPVILWSKWGFPISTKDVFHAAKAPLAAGVFAGMTGAACRYALEQFLGMQSLLFVGVCLTFFTYLCFLLFVLGQRARYVELVRHIMPRTLIKCA